MEFRRVNIETMIRLRSWSDKKGEKTDRIGLL